MVHLWPIVHNFDHLLPNCGTFVAYPCTVVVQSPPNAAVVVEGHSSSERLRRLLVCSKCATVAQNWTKIDQNWFKNAQKNAQTWLKLPKIAQKCSKSDFGDLGRVYPGCLGRGRAKVPGTQVKRDSNMCSDPICIFRGPRPCTLVMYSSHCIPLWWLGDVDMTSWI